MSLEIPEVVVTAQYGPTDSRNALQNIRTIKRSIIEQQGANNLEQLLQQDPNIRIRQDALLGSSMSLLGVSGQNVKIMIDGVPIVGRLDGNIDLSQINLNNVERIEIIEGPMSVSYGTDALGGVINLITKKSQRYPYELNLNQQLETRAESSVGLDAGIRLKDKLLLRLNGGYDWFNGLSSDTARSVLWNPKQQAYFDANLRYDFGEDHQIRYQFGFFDEEVQNLGNIRRPAFKPYAFDDSFLTRRVNHSLSHEGSILKNYYWQNILSYNQFDRKVNSYRTNFEENEEIFLAGDSTIFDTYLFRSVFASNFRDRKVNFQLGTELTLEQGAGGRIIDPDADQIGESEIGDYAIFGSLRYQPISDLTLETGLRATYNTRYDAPLIPSFHLKYKWSPALSLRASYGKGFRSPSLKELFMSFIDINHFIIGNPDLLAETSDNFQLNVGFNKEIRQQRINLKLQLFHNQIQDQIQLFPFLDQNGTTVPTTPDLSQQFAYFNLEKNITKGATLNANYQWKDLELGVGIANILFYNPLSEVSNEVQTFTPTTELSGKISYRLPMIDTKFNLFLRKNDRFISYFPGTENGETVARQQTQDGFTMVDLSFSKSVFNQRLNLTAGVRNLLNITQVNVSGGNAGVHNTGTGLTPIGPGRSFFLRASLRLFDNQAAKFKNPPLEKQQKSAFNLFQNDKQTYASWIENRNDGEQVLQYAERKNQAWTSPKTIAIGDQKWFINDLETPQITQFPQNPKALLASWLVNSNPRNVYDHHLSLSQSKNGGKQWSSSFRPYSSEVPAYYGFLKFAPIAHDQLLTVWMDGRDTKQKIKDTEKYFPNLKGKMRLYTSSINKKGKVAPEQFLTDDFKALCPFELQTNGVGDVLLVYRNQQNNIVVQQYQKNEWKTAKEIHQDQWATKVTTEGPIMDIINERVAIAWYTEQTKQAKLQLALSNNNGNDFAMINSPELPKLIGQMDLIWLDETTLALAWLEKQDKQTILKLGHLNLQGQITHQETLFTFPGEIGPNKPQLAYSKGEILIAWKPNYQTDLLLLTRQW
ncbi:MAG: hypothetical protein Sapg2KO_50590 [Saprospiraceae bacterium]